VATTPRLGHVSVIRLGKSEVDQGSPGKRTRRRRLDARTRSRHGILTDRHPDLRDGLLTRCIGITLADIRARLGHGSDAAPRCDSWDGVAGNSGSIRSSAESGRGTSQGVSDQEHQHQPLQETKSSTHFAVQKADSAVWHVAGTADTLSTTLGQSKMSSGLSTAGGAAALLRGQGVQGHVTSCAVARGPSKPIVAVVVMMRRILSAV
jgi:hypothetical protein